MCPAVYTPGRQGWQVLAIFNRSYTWYSFGDYYTCVWMVNPFQKPCTPVCKSVVQIRQFKFDLRMCTYGSNFKFNMCAVYEHHIAYHPSQKKTTPFDYWWMPDLENLIKMKGRVC